MSFEVPFEIPFQLLLELQKKWLDQNVIELEFELPYSREQKHVSISDTPMLLIEINSISNRGCPIS